MAGAFRKLGTVAVGGAVVAMGTVNAYQLGKMKGFYQHPEFLKMNNHDAAELVGVSLGIGQHRSVFVAPTDGFAKDPLRAALHTTVTDQYEKGLMNGWQKGCVEHVNAELYHQGIPLRPEESAAITDAHIDMHRCKEDFTESPRQWCAEKFRTEARIANAFLEGGSKIGYIAHMSKGIMEAALCVAAQPIAVHGKAMKEKMAAASAGHLSSTANFKEQFSAVKNAGHSAPVASTEDMEQETNDRQIKGV